MISLLLGAGVALAFAAGPHQTTGIKIGEVDQDSAIVWTRLTRDGVRVPDSVPLPTVSYVHKDTGEVLEQRRPAEGIPTITMPEGVGVDGLPGAAPGAEGDVRVGYGPKGGELAFTEWAPVEPAKDYTRQFVLEGLTPGTDYIVRVESRSPSGEAGETVEGAFGTAPAPGVEATVRFTVTTGTDYPDLDVPGQGFRMYDAMLPLEPDFFVHTGDILYYDDFGKTYDLALWHWQRTYSLPTNVRFHKLVPSYFEKDDHDTWANDCWPGKETESPFMGDLTFAQGQEIFLHQVPMGEKTYRTFRWGKDLQVWLVEGRDFRSHNHVPDGPDKTIWGAEQIAWFKETVAESDATFRILVSPTPVVGPDRVNKNDNHANEGFAHEGAMLREFIASQKNMVVVCGDRHWQYVSVDAKTGLKEYSCGPGSDEHAGGWSNDQRYPEHQYLNVIGGFLEVEVTRDGGAPVLIARHRHVDGKILNEDRVPAE